MDNIHIDIFLVENFSSILFGLNECIRIDNIFRSKDKRGYFMSGNSLLNLSYGERKDKEKKGVPLTSPMAFQSKISQTYTKSAASPYRTPGSSSKSSSPYTSRTPGKTILVHQAHSNKCFYLYNKQIYI